ncbi:hypothetical protein GGR53DRAFT_527718 [Hypoxylon sp. FL1150]|nr:hypothetical protein GGR53DRAFT_527718 [Hypoxylon sp. FL1150]
MSTCPAEPTCDVDPFKADPDIAGIGVIVAFLITAWSSLLIVTADYFSTPNGERPVLLDDIVIGCARKVVKKPWPVQAIRPAVLMMSDQQLVTGTAILSVGYIQHCTVTQYHFFVIFLLGFVSCQVYDASLNSLHGHFGGRRPAMKLWRAVLMTTLFGMVILNIFVIDHDDFLTYFGSSTQCIWDNLFGAGHYQLYALDLGLSLALLSWEYLDGICLIYPRVFKPIRRALNIFRLLLFCCQAPHLSIERLRSRYDQEAMESCQSIIISIGRKLINMGLLTIQLLLLALFLPIFTLSEILKSDILNIWRVYSALLWATMTIAETKNDAISYDLIQGSESDWGFGQLLPLFLLILPAMAIVELFQGSGDDKVAEDTITCPKCKHQMPLLSHSHRGSCEEAAANSSKPTSDTASPEHEDFQLSRKDTEALIGAGNKPEEKVSRHDKLDLQQRMRGSPYFMAWLVFCALAAFGGSTYAAINGWAI